MKEAKKSKSRRIAGKSFLIAAFLVILTLFVFSFTSCCNLSSLADRFIKTQGSDKSSSTVKESINNNGGTPGSEEESTIKEAPSPTEAATKSTPGSEAGTKEYGIAYFEVTSSSESNHFEHRVGNIYAVSADGADKKLIYSDINDKYDLGNIFGASPDGTKILGMLADGGRGAYSAICVIDILTGKLTKLAEFDFTASESGEINLGLYGKPVWSNDSTRIAYELVTNPYLSPFNSNFRDAGLFITDVQTGGQKEVNIDVGGASARSTTFLTPVFFAENDAKIFMVSHPYYEKKENGKTVNFYTLNDTLYSVNADGGVPVKIVGVGPGDFSAAEPEVISSFDNFRLMESVNRIVFQVLGDFEEDGDLWACNYDGTGLKKITENNQLREQQPSVFDSSKGDPKIAYVGSLRYGTISAQIPSGDIFIVNADGSGNKKLTDLKIGPSVPSISPDGSSIAFLFSEYDENMTNIQANYIMIYDLENETLEKISSEAYLVSIAGWVRTK
jgi:hypothetical protein